MPDDVEYQDNYYGGGNKVFLLVATGLSILFSLVTGGKMDNLARVPLRALYLGVVALLLQIATFSLTRFAGSSAALLNAGLHLLSYVLLGVLLWLNWRVPGFAVLGAGMVANLAVIAANKGQMPVVAANLARIGYPEAAVALQAGQIVNNAVLWQESTRLKWLGDIFCLPRPFPFPNVFSVGDVLIAVGVALFFWQSMRQESRN